MLSPVNLAGMQRMRLRALPAQGALTFQRALSGGRALSGWMQGLGRQAHRDEVLLPVRDRLLHSVHNFLGSGSPHAHAPLFIPNHHHSPARAQLFINDCIPGVNKHLIYIRCPTVGLERDSLLLLQAVPLTQDSPEAHGLATLHHLCHSGHLDHSFLQDTAVLKALLKSGDGASNSCLAPGLAARPWVSV